MRVFVLADYMLLLSPPPSPSPYVFGEYGPAFVRSLSPPPLPARALTTSRGSYTTVEYLRTRREYFESSGKRLEKPKDSKCHRF